MPVTNFMSKQYCDSLQALVLLMKRMEQLGAAPLLNDNLVGGNCGILVVSGIMVSIFTAG